MNRLPALVGRLRSRMTSSSRPKPLARFGRVLARKRLFSTERLLAIRRGGAFGASVFLDGLILHALSV